MMAHHLAQLNIARAVAPLDDPRMADFIAQIDRINSLAERSPGFVWRLTTADGKSSSYVRSFEDERMLVNLSVWESPDALKDFVFKAEHAHVMKDRRKWFEASDLPYLVLWWIPAGHVPTVAEAMSRLRALDENGPSGDAFDFKQVFAPPLD